MESVSRSGSLTLTFLWIWCVRWCLNIFYSTWGLLRVGLMFAILMMHMRISDHTAEDDDDYDNDDGDSSIPPRRSDDRVAA
jgi:hypothetical protein